MKGILEIIYHFFYPSVTPPYPVPEHLYTISTKYLSNLCLYGINETYYQGCPQIACVMVMFVEYLLVAACYMLNILHVII